MELNTVDVVIYEESDEMFDKLLLESLDYL